MKILIKDIPDGSIIENITEGELNKKYQVKREKGYINCYRLPAGTFAFDLTIKEENNEEYVRTGYYYKILKPAEKEKPYTLGEFLDEGDT